jgi:hypothetical protein
LHSGKRLPTQEDDEFSDLPVVVFRGPRFSIEVYYWLDGTTAIHQHGFSGAFHVLLGSSIHCQYSFVCEREINPHFAVGKIDVEHVELLRTGEIRQINAGQSFIHSLFHLDRPSVTITVRTYSTPQAQPQYAFLTPFVAVDPFYKEPTLKKKLQSVRLLLQMDHPETDSFINDLISTSDFQTTFSVLKAVFDFSNDDGQPDRFINYLNVARRKHGDLANILHPVFSELKRKKMLVTKRKQITAPEHRFFLALILNLKDRTRVLELVKQRFPEQDAVATVLRWIGELSNIKPFAAANSSATGAAFDEIHLFMIESLLRGVSPKHTVEQAKARCSPDHAPRVEVEFDNLCSFLRSSILRTLFFNDAVQDEGMIARATHVS